MTLARTPIARTGTLKRSGLSRRKSIGRAKTLLKSRRPKSTPLRRAARGQDCTLMIPGVCNRNPETTVLCHSNRLADGKGMGLKAPDTEACFGCSDCHDVLDGRRPLPGWMTRDQLDDTFDRARAITHDKLKQEGLMP